MTELHEHHRQLRRGGDERPVNLLRVGPVLHDWIHKHPAEARELGWIVSQHEDPADVIVTIPDSVVSVEKPARKAKASTPEERKARVNYSIKTPKDEENILPEREADLRELLVDLRGWKKNVPAYFIWEAAAHIALEVLRAPKGAEV